MKNNVNIDNTIENIEDVAVETVEEVVKVDKITSAKMLQSTKDIIDTFNLKGNQQEKLDTLVKEYKKLLEQAEGTAKTEIVGLDLSGDFKNFAKELDIFVKTMEQKVNVYMNDTVATNVSNTEKEFKIMHNEFIKYLEETQKVAVASETELEANKQKVAELTSKIDELTNTVEKYKSENKELTDRYVKLDKECTRLANKNADLLDSVASYSSKYENEKSSKNAQIENNNTLKNEIRDLKEAVKSYKEEIADNNSLLETISSKKSDLEVENEKLRVSNASLIEKNTQLEEDNMKMNDTKKDIFEKVELVSQLEKRNELLSNELKEFNALKAKNVELEGTIKALESQSKLLETTLNTINTTISSIADAKVVAEEKSSKLEIENTRLADENSKLLKELEDLKKQLKAKK